VKVTWWGHATVEVEDAGTTILTDPVLRDRLAHLWRRRGPTPRPAEPPHAVVISHLHADHCDLVSLRMLPRRTTLIVPRGAARFLRRQVGADRHYVELGAGEETAIGALKVRAVPAEHDACRMPRSKVRAEPVGYLLSGTRTTWFAGDTGLFDGMADFGPVDLALVPVWGWGFNLGPGHLDPAGAAEAVRRVAPRWAVPIHWGTLWPMGFGRIRPDRFHRPGAEFADFSAVKVPATNVHVLAPGDSLALHEAAGRPGGLEAWSSP
jgi:L-ascorbate metabolism protein UlaG (beta-lactamase superfamily)